MFNDDDTIILGLKLFLIFICTFLVVFIVTVVSNAYGVFEFKTIDGYYGTAKTCYTSYGNMYCIDDDGATISVVEYKKVR